jgi:hypothetical protein
MPLELRADDDDDEVRSVEADTAEIAWVVLFVDALVLWATALYWLRWGHFFDDGFYEATTGGSWEVVAGQTPYIEDLAGAAVRLAGFFCAAVAIFVIAVATTSFRRHEPWAWYVTWSLPALAALDFALLAAHGAVTVLSVTWDATIGGLALVALLVPYRDFFPDERRQPFNPRRARDR